MYTELTNPGEAAERPVKAGAGYWAARPAAAGIRTQAKPPRRSPHPPRTSRWRPRPPSLRRRQGLSSPVSFSRTVPPAGAGGREAAAGCAPPSPCRHGARLHCPDPSPPACRGGLGRAAGRARRRSLGERVPCPSRRRLVRAASVEQLGRKCWRGAVRTGSPLVMDVSLEKVCGARWGGGGLGHLRAEAGWAGP